MHVDFNRVIHNLKGLPLSMDGEPVTVKFAVITALLNTYPDEMGLDGQEKARRFRLARAISQDQASITPTEVDLIKTLVGKTFGPPVVGPVFEIFDEALSGDKPASEAQPLKRALEQAMEERAEAGLDQPLKRGKA